MRDFGREYARRHGSRERGRESDDDSHYAERRGNGRSRETSSEDGRERNRTPETRIHGGAGSLLPSYARPGEFELYFGPYRRP